MPLPEGGNMPWPPRYLKPALTDMHIWDTWWAGDPDRLTSLYGGGVTSGFDPKRGQYAGGLVGRLSRWWWGQPTPAGEERSHIHVPIAGDICAMSARLLFAEPPKITAADRGTQDQLTEYLDDRAHARLKNAAEVSAMLGGVYLRTVHDTDISDRPWIDTVHADRAVPEFTWGMLRAVTFWRIMAEDDGQVWRHLERHEPGWVMHGLYQGTRDQLGMPVPLEDMPALAGLAREVDSEGRIATNIKGLGPTYVANRMSRRWRSMPGLEHLGRSDLDGVVSLMDNLDEAYGSWMRDIRLAKGRVHVPESMLDSNGPGRGSRFDVDREVYATLNALQRPGNSLTLAVTQFAIRAAEHKATVDDLVERILTSAGYSTQTFGASDQVAITATEVDSKERLTGLTKADKVLTWRPELSHALGNWLATYREVFGAKVSTEPPAVAFADGIREDMLTLANTVDALRRAQAASTQTLVEIVHPDWDPSQVSAEVARILAETGMATEDPTAFGADELPPGDDFGQESDPIEG
ncbi:capsid protein [Embleya scabrispora]|uniref:Capsid protein n=1 Tax=Embleya scabrispora TaxID=159449 RepID=A0A1T3P1Y8_9ACTN|nr:capsid protein [Embleya scabrispora]OPC83014.1 capsid protein [Embleya scabrispora]